MDADLDGLRAASSPPSECGASIEDSYGACSSAPSQTGRLVGSGDVGIATYVDA